MRRMEKLFLVTYRLGLLLFLGCFLLTISSVAQYKYDGVARNNSDYCAFASGRVTVKRLNYNPTTQTYSLMDATDLTECLGMTGTINGNAVTPRASDKYFCFNGSESKYYLKIGDNPYYKWLSESSRITEGVYDLEEFGAIKDTSLNNTYTIKNAVVYIGSRPSSGGKLKIPNGVFKVTGDVLPPSTQPPTVTDSLPIVLPPGITIEGTNGKSSFASSRIQIDVVNEGLGTVFKIGNCTDFVTVRELGIVTPEEVYGTQQNPIYQYREGTKAIHANGFWSNTLPTQSRHFVFSGLTIQGFEEGISVLATDASKIWQFDNIQVENCEINGLYPIRVDAQNTDWVISNTTVNTSNHRTDNPRGIGIWLQRGGVFTIDNVYGGAPKITGSIVNRTKRPEAFIKVSGPVSGLNIRGSEAEETDNSLVYDFYNPWQDTEKYTITLTGNILGDPVRIKQSVALVSIGNFYLSNTVQIDGVAQGGNSKTTQIYSYGDTFSGVTYQRKICEASPGVVMPNGWNYGIADKAAVSDCRRDFYIYNNYVFGEQNTVVVKTGQRRSGVLDSDGIDQNTIQSPLRIVSPPIYEPAQLPPFDGTTYQFADRLKYWGYTIKRSSVDGFLEFEGNQKPPDFSWGDYTGFRFYGSVYPSADGQFELGNLNKRWSLVRAVTVASGDLILSDKVTGKELYKIHEDEESIHFQDVRTGKELMRLDRNGNLIVSGKIYQEGNAPSDVNNNKINSKGNE